MTRACSTQWRAVRRGSNATVGLSAAFLLIAVGGAQAQSKPLFRVRTQVSGLDYVNVSGSAEQLPILEQNGQGVGFIDYDGDGLIDLFVTNGGTESRWRDRRLPGCRLYRNLGHWQFEDVTDRAGVRGGAWSIGVAVADYDADGDFDLYVLNWGPNTLFRNNGDGTFENVTTSSGVGEPQWSSSAAFADFNGDGLLDIYVSNYVAFDFDKVPKREKDGSPCLYHGIETGCGPWCYEGVRDTLYINIGHGRFADRSTEAGLDGTAGYRGFGVVAADFDDDGDVDVYVGCDVMPNLYLANDGRGRFSSVGLRRGGAYNGSGVYESGMGVAAADFDGNGTLDLFVTNFSDQKNTFYRNEHGVFLDESGAIGLDRHRVEMGWGILAQDFNLDGLVDLFIANGHIYPQLAHLADPTYRCAQPPRLYVQKRGRSLNDRARGGVPRPGIEPLPDPDGHRDGTDLWEPSPEVAFGQPLAMNLRGCAAGDIDNDGDLDVVAVQHNGPLVLFENTSNRPATTVELIDARGGRSPMGSRVTTKSGTRYLLPNQGYQSSNDHRLHIPVPPGAATVEIEVRWPNGQRQTRILPIGRGKTIRVRQKVTQPSG